jgi:cullin 1
MQNRSFDFKSSWEKLDAGLHLIIQVKRGIALDGKKISFADWMALYNIVVSWCTVTEDKKKDELYGNLTKFFENVVDEEYAQLKSKRGFVLLKEYLHRMENFSGAANMIKNIFAYMQRYWIPSQQQNQGAGLEVRPVFEAALVRWRSKAYDPLKSKLLDALLQLVAAERDGEKVDKTLLSNMVQGYIKIGLPPAENPVSYYKKEFQDPFIKATKEYYIAESDAFIQANTVSNYMQKAEERILQEEELATSYLHNTTKVDLVRACEEVLINRHNTQLQDEFQKMLRDDKSEDMRRFHYLLSRIAGGVDRSAETMKQFLTQVGTGIVKDHSTKLTQRTNLKDSTPLILALLDLHKKYSDILKRCFSDSKLFCQALDEAFGVFINQKAGEFLMSEVLNNYVDSVMSGAERIEDELLYTQLDSVVRLFTYFHDKDIFYDAFRRSLSKRLLTQKVKEEWERHFLQRLKVTCGDAYTKKLEGMFNDVKISNDQFNPNFREWCSKKKVELECELSVTVLNDNYWPATARVQLTPALDFSPCTKAFEEFYGCAAQKKMLIWLYQQGDTTVVHTPAPVGGKKSKDFLLNMSCTQASICLLFNQSQTWRFKDIIEQLGTTEDALKYAITPLLYTADRVFANKGKDGKGKPQNKTADGKPEPITWDSLVDEDVIAIVPIKSAKVKVVYPPGKQLPRPNNPNAGKSQDPTPQDQVLKERELKMQLALVRVMKARVTYTQQQLIAEATDQLAKFFMADPRIMKKQIEILMERNFMRRDPEDQRKIHYCA